MILRLTGKFPLSVKKSQLDSIVVDSRMSEAALVVGKAITPCIVRKVMYGKLENLQGESEVSVLMFKRVRHTNHTRKGFVDVQITTKSVQFSVYIHVDHLEKFFGSCAMTIVHTGLSD